MEWGHTSLTELIIVNDIHERKRLMISDVDAVIALPGGCGTLEELFEAITWKRLGLYSGPIVMVNTMNFFAPCIELLNHCIDQRFMDPRHAAMWSVVDRPADVVEAIRQAPPWRPEYRSFAGLMRRLPHLAVGRAPDRLILRFAGRDGLAEGAPAEDRQRD